MAAIQDPSTLELASSLTQAEIPIKLRCATCNKLAINAFKLPCCDQSICETCQESLPESCPVCAHSPLDASTCKQNKSLRLTVKAFLKSEEKKRGKTAVEAQAPIESAPAAPEPPATPAPAAPDTATTGDIVDEAPIAPKQSEAGLDLVEPSNDVVQSIEQPAEDVPSQTQQEQVPDADLEVTNNQVDQDRSYQSVEGNVPELDHENETHHNEQNGQDWSQESAQHAESAGDNNLGQSGNQQQQGFIGMDWSSQNGFNPMMQMQNMPNGGFGGFPGMMGMPGMGMNTMNMPPNMFGGFGGMGMNDMSGMNMGMGFGGGFGGWNGQQGMGGNFGSGNYPNGGYNQQQMHQGPFGSQMHQQQFPNHNYHNRRQGQPYQRGYGRGRGGYGGRGGQFSQFQNPEQGRQQFANGTFDAHNAEDSGIAHQLPNEDHEGRQSQARSDIQRSASQADISVDPARAEAMDGQLQQSVAPSEVANNGETQQDGETDWIEQNDNTNHGTHDDFTAAEDSAQINDAINGSYDDEHQGDGMDYQSAPQDDMKAQTDADAYVSNGKTNDFLSQDVPQMQMPMDTYGGMHVPTPNNNYHQMNNQPWAPHGPRGGRGGYGRGGYRGRGGYGQARGGYGGSYANGMAVPEDITVLAGLDQGPPIDAPKGPKAMREGLPNSGIYSRPGYGNVARRTSHSEQPAEPPRSVANESMAGETEQEAKPEPAATRTRSSSRDRKRKERERSRSVISEDEEARQRRRERRRRRERDLDDDERRSSRKDGDTGSRRDRLRSSSRDDSSSRRHRHRDKDGHRSSRSHRDYSRDSRHHGRRSDDDHANGRDDTRSQSNDHKSRSHRDRDHDRERDRKRDHEKDREHDRDKDKKRSRRDHAPSTAENDFQRRYESSRRSRHSRDDQVETTKEVMGPPSDDVGFKIKGSRSAALKASTVAPAEPASFEPPTGPKKNRNRERNDDQERGQARRSSVQSQQPAAAETKSVDPYAQEREARHRERVLKEQQRRESATLGKRPRESLDGGDSAAEAFDPPTGPKAEKDRGGRRRGDQDGSSKSRRVSYKYEDEERGEERASRVEREREAGRWR